MSFGSAITATIGADVGPLQAAGPQVATAAGNIAGQIAKKFEFRDIGRTLSTALGLNLTNLAQKLVQPFQEASESASRIADESERAAAAVERLIALRQTDVQQLAVMETQAKRIGEELEQALNKGPSKSFFAGLIERGSALDKIIGFSRREDASRQELIAQKDREAKEKAVEIEVKKQAIVKQGSVEELRAIKENLAADEKRADAIKRLAAFEREQTLVKMSSGEKINALEKERRAVAADIAKYDKFQREGGELTAIGITDLLGLKEQQRDLENEILALTKGKAEAEKITTAEIQTQIEALEQKALMEQLGSAGREQSRYLVDGVWVNGTPRDKSTIEGASPGELQELIRRNTELITKFKAGAGSGPGALAEAASGYLVRGLAISTLATEIEMARQRINQTNSLRGADYGSALKKFDGDPLQFDRYYQAANNTYTESKRSADTLEQVRRGIEGLTETIRAKPRI